MDNLVALSIVYNRVFMYANHKEDPIRIPQGKDPYVSARTLSQYYYDTPAEHAVLVVPASEPWLSKSARTQMAEKQNIKVKRTINPGCAAALTDLYRNRQEGLVLAVVQWDRTVEAVLMDTMGDIATVLSVGYDMEADDETVQRILKNVLKEGAKKPEEVIRVVLVEDARREDGVASRSLHAWTGSNTVFVKYALQEILEGAYHYGAQLMGKEQFVVMVDALPSTFGIRTVDGFCPVIERNLNFPTQGEIWVYPQNDRQTSMEITVQEQFCSGNLARVGSYRVDLPASGTAEDRKVRVHLDVDANSRFFLRIWDARNQTLTARQGQDDANLLPAAAPKAAAKKDTPAGPAPVKTMNGVDSRNAALEFLGVYDTLLMAADYASADPAHMKGILQTLRKMEEVFSRFGIEFYGTPGDNFDPHIHEAVLYTESDKYGKNEVIRVLQKGVRADGKIVRVAMVQVAN